MISYDEEWIIPLIFRLDGSVMFRAGMFALPAAVLALFLVLLDDWYPEFREDFFLQELSKSQFWSVSIFVLSSLLSFRTNRAMARFWEGTGLLHQMRGEWFDSVSCCVTFSRAAIFQKRTEVMVFRHTIVRLMSLCHGSALEEIAGENAEECETIDSFGLDNKTLQHLKECKETHHFNRVEVLLHMIQSLITKNLDDGVLKIPPPILSRVYQTLSRGFVNLLNAKKIADTRFPFPFVQLITMLLMMNVVVTPLLISSLCRSKVWAPLFTFVPIFACFYLNFVGVELENPFGNDANDLPLDHFQAEMNKCLLMLLQESADLIPGISKTRCITDFTTIKTTMRPSCAHDGTQSEPPRRSETRRLSQFSDYFDIYADDEDSFDYTDISHKFQRASLATLPLETKEAKEPEIVKEAKKAPELENQKPPPIPENAVLAGAITGTSNKSFSNDVLSKSMLDFNTALHDLKRSAETRVTDLNRSISAVKDFSNTLSTLLDTLSVDLRETNSRPQTLPKTPHIGKEASAIKEASDSSNKPLLQGPATSSQISRITADRLDAPIVV